MYIHGLKILRKGTEFNVDKQAIPVHSMQLLEPEWRKKCALFV
jgi:hypothetical protein